MPLSTTHKRLVAGALVAVVPAVACALVAASIVCDMGSGCHGGQRRQVAAVVFVAVEVALGLLVAALIAGTVAVRQGIQVVRPELSLAEAWFITALLVFAWWTVRPLSAIVLIVMVFLAIKGTVGRRAPPPGMPGGGTGDVVPSATGRDVAAAASTLDTVADDTDESMGDTARAHLIGSPVPEPRRATR
jgi:hypothetical protein